MEAEGNPAQKAQFGQQIMFSTGTSDNLLRGGGWLT